MGQANRVVLSYALTAGLFAAAGGGAYVISEGGQGGDAEVAAVVADQAQAPPVGGGAIEDAGDVGAQATPPADPTGDEEATGSRWGTDGADALPDGFESSDPAEVEPAEAPDPGPVDIGREDAGAEDGGEVAPDADEVAPGPPTADTAAALLRRKGLTRDGVNYILADVEAEPLEKIRQAMASWGTLSPLVVHRDYVANTLGKIEKREDRIEDLHIIIARSNRIMGKYPGKRPLQNSAEGIEFFSALNARSACEEQVELLHLEIRELRSTLPDERGRARLNEEVGRRGDAFYTDLTLARSAVEQARQSYESIASDPEVVEAINALRATPDQRSVRIRASTRLKEAIEQLGDLEQAHGRRP